MENAHWSSERDSNGGVDVILYIRHEEVNAVLRPILKITNIGDILVYRNDVWEPLALLSEVSDPNAILSDKG